MKRVALYAMAVGLVFALPFASDAQQPKAKTAASPDQKFIKEAATDGKAEVELGKLASERGGSDAVKQFGQKMATDHGKANDELAQLAQQKGITLPSDLDAKHKKLHDRLSKLSGAEFDAAYMREMVRDHDKDVKDFQRESQRGKDADVKAWAAKTLPTLQEHDQLAKQTQASLKGGSSPSASGRSK